jgi:hypothetical protein
MKPLDAFHAIQDLCSKRVRGHEITFNYLPYGSATETFAVPSVIRGYYPTEPLWSAEGGRGGVYMYVGTNDEILYVGKSCGSKPHGAKKSGIAHEAVSKITKPVWKQRDLFSHYDLRNQFRRRKDGAAEATAAVEAGAFYLAFVVIRNERMWLIDALNRIADDLEGHVLFVHKRNHEGRLPPLNADDDARQVDIGRPWGS